MTSTSQQPESSDERQTLRLWPGVVIVVLLALTRLVVPIVKPEATPFAVMSGLAGGLAVIVWWMAFSRARWKERFFGLGAMVLTLFATSLVVHESISKGMMGFMFPVYAIPCLCFAFVAWAAASRNLADGPRRAWMIVAMVIGCAGWTLVRTGGFSSTLDHEFAWRWSKTPEDRLLSHAGEKSFASSRTATVSVQPVPSPGKSATSWPGFRGPGRDGIVRGVRIEADWTASKPVELWRQPVGPGWSSFAVNGGLLYTQEQRGEDEVVACYNLTTGAPVWSHRDTARFWESNAGPGPRGTPTLHDGRVYTFGATGILNALDAASGTVVWSRNAATDTKTKVPDWGFASSPLVVADMVIAAVGGTMAAYDLATGAPRWAGPADDKSYSSPQLMEIDGVRQILLMSGAGATSVAPADGRVLWQHAWKGFAIVQPSQISKGDLLISTGDRLGARRIQVSHTNDAWSVEERWTSTRLKAYFSDFVLHRGHAFGFDGGILACVDLEDGERKWKGGRYGSGQLVLLADQDLLLVISEQGDLALVAAVLGEFTELARFPALTGKTWNHPVLAGDVLLVRNDREMAAFRLSLKSAP